ncbi:unnamed protein product [Symbiodinium natans]|uniref:Class I SAM-dependent methyltransferase n=1 Tax=Symbiodinium natans TaxID=878477 RepID=A0A812NKK3_9DINO|nr:unnamed protein product [Symbiodinium natans]
MDFVSEKLSDCDRDHLLPPQIFGRTFRNTTLPLLDVMKQVDLVPETGSPASLATWVASQWDSTLMHIIILTTQMATLCLADMYHWAGFDSGCQQIHKSLRHLAKEVPERLRFRPAWPATASVPSWIEAATERAIEVLQSELWSLTSSLCMHLPSPYPSVDARTCGAMWTCWTMHARMAQLTAVLTSWSYIVQLQLEMALLWTLFPPPAPRPMLPDLVLGMDPGDIVDHVDIQGSAMSSLLRLAFPKTKISKIYMVEVGVHRANLAVHLLQKHRHLHYLGIDPYKGRYEGRTAEEQLLRFGAAEHFRTSVQRLRRFGQRAHLCRRTSVQASHSPLHTCRSRWAVANLDVIFIDGEHDFASVDQDLRLWAPRVRPGGLVAGHDYRLPDAFDVVQAVHRHLPPGQQLQVGPDGIWWWIA